MTADILHEFYEAVAIGALASQTALKIGNDYISTGMAATFLTKRIELSVAVAMTGGEGPLLVGIARGELTVAEIKTALQSANDNGPVDQLEMQAHVHELFWAELIENHTNHVTTIKRTLKLGGGKGIPMLEDVGWQWFVYNTSSGALTTGGVISIWARHFGKWLDG